MSSEPTHNPVRVCVPKGNPWRKGKGTDMAKARKMPRYRSRGINTNARTRSQIVSSDNRRAAKRKQYWNPEYVAYVERMTTR